MTLGEPFLPNEPEWLIRAQVGFPPIQKTSELPVIIPPLPTGDTKDLKVWKEYWMKHDAATRKDEREKVLDYMIRYIDEHKDAVFGTATSIRARMVELRRQSKDGEPIFISCNTPAHAFRLDLKKDGEQR